MKLQSRPSVHYVHKYSQKYVYMYYTCIHMSSMWFVVVLPNIDLAARNRTLIIRVVAKVVIAEYGHSRIK